MADLKAVLLAPVMLLAPLWLAAVWLPACGAHDPAPAVAPTEGTHDSGHDVQAPSAVHADSGPILMTVRGWHMAKDRGMQGPFAIGDTLHSGDLFNYYVRVDRDAYVYVMQFFADDSAKVLFPEVGDVRLSANQEARIPSDAGQWFQLDEAIGTEHLYVIASNTPLKESSPDLAKLVGEVRTSPSALVDKPDSGEHFETPPDLRVADGRERKLVDQPRHDAPPPIATRPALPTTTVPPRGAPAPENRFQVRLRGHRTVELVRVDASGHVAYEGRTGQDGVGVAHFPFRHE